METIPLELPEQVLMLRRGSRSPIPTPEEQERRALMLKNDLLLHEAVIKNDSDAVKKILKEPLDINSRNNYGRAPIHWAASRGSIDIMEMLIGANCDIEARDKYGMRPILMAAWHGHKDAVQVLVNAGAATNSTNKKHFGLLHCAAHTGRLSVVDWVLNEVEAIAVDTEDSEGRTALYAAAAAGHEDVVRRLHAAGANPMQADHQGRTALHAAAAAGHRLAAEVLLVAASDVVHCVDQQKNTALHAAAEQKQTDLVQLLLDAGADPDAENQKGLSPLHIASSLGSRGIIESLLQHGASLDKQNKMGNTALHLACQTNESTTVELLITKGADLNCLNNRLQSPMHIAAEMGHTDVCKMLLAAGANIEQKEHTGRTPLYVAARGSFTAIVDMIIKTARLDYPSYEEPKSDLKKKHLKKPVLNTARQKLRTSSEESAVYYPESTVTNLENNERLRAVLYKLAYKQLVAGEWKRLAHHWAFTDDQIRAIEHQYTGPASYKEHGFRMLLIWVHGLSGDVNPIKELCESLTAIDRKSVADLVRRKVDQENEERAKRGKKKCPSCSIT